MNNHKLYKHEGIVWPRKICQFKAATQPILKQHTKFIHFVNDQIDHKCEYCYQSFATKKR